MSRTTSHRPAWVQANEHGTRESHRHDLFGKPRIVYRTVRDKRGRALKETYRPQISIRTALSLTPSLAPDFEARSRQLFTLRTARQLQAAGVDLETLIDSPSPARERTVTAPAVIGHYLDYCTIDEPSDRDERLAGTADVYLPCVRWIGGWDAGRSYSRTRGERRARTHLPDKNLPSRRSRAALRALAQLADAGEDVEEALDMFHR